MSVEHRETSPNSFPLRIWEESEEYACELQEAKKRVDTARLQLGDRGFTCTYMDLWHFDENGYPQIWLNHNNPIWFPPPGNAEDALYRANRHGSGITWSIEALEQFAQGDGPIIEKAMWEMGFRRNKRDNSQWSKRSSKDPQPSFENHILPTVDTVTGADALRLKQLWTMAENPHQFLETYSLTAGSRGMLYVQFDVNPFMATRAEDLGSFGAAISQRGHIDPYQDGFTLQARNIIIEEERGIYLTGTRSGESVVESVWPMRVTQEELHNLANNFITAVKENS